jgi:hypothetical protein
MDRRNWLRTAALGVAAGSLRQTSPTFGAVASSDDLIAEVQRATIFRGSLGADGKPSGKTWFSTRACMFPSEQGLTGLMLMAEIGGSDYFGPVHETISTDLGKSWSKPQPVPGMGRLPFGDESETEATVCDMVPEYHAPTGTVLAMGHDVFYRGGKFFKAQPPRHTMYAVRGADGSWSSLARLEWNDPRGKYIYTCNCAQRLTTKDGDVLVPLSVGATSNSRSVVVVRCSFDGNKVVVRDVSNELQMNKGRGFLEPSLARFQGRCFLTLRAEDNHGYVCTSDDGLRWSAPQAWRFDDGTPLAMSTTQQRWLVHSDALYLVYTRRDDSNGDVMRWRAPLFAARVDADSLRLVRDTERIVVPLSGDGVRDGRNVPHLGNFHVCTATNDESWITVGDYKVTNFRGDVTLARVRWRTPIAR